MLRKWSRFLWVRFQLDELEDESHSEATFRGTLADLPKGLIETCHRIINKISKRPSQIVSIADQLLKWTLAARRPLSIEELQEAVSIRVGDRSLNPTGTTSSTRPSGPALLRACGGLVTFDEVDGSVRLTHHSVGQFLMHHRFQRADADRLLGDICYTYLMFEEFQGIVAQPKPAASSTQPVPLATTVVKYMPGLFRFGFGRSVCDFILGLYFRKTQSPLPSIDYMDILKSYQLQPPKANFDCEHRLLDYVVHNWVWHTPSCTSDGWELPLEKLAMTHEIAFDFRPWGANVGPQGLPYLTLYLWALERAHVPLLRLLHHPPKGRTHHSYIYYARDSLAIESLGSQAVSSDSLELFKMTLEYQLNPPDTFPKLMLCAAKQGRPQFAKLLLQHGFGQNNEEHDEEGLTSLHCAAAMGHTSFLRDLRNAEYDLNAFDKRGETPLEYAIRSKHLSTTQFLLESIGSLDSKTYLFQKALDHAIREDSIEIICLLLKNSATAGRLDGGVLVEATLRADHPVRKELKHYLWQQALQCVFEEESLEHVRLFLENIVAHVGVWNTISDVKSVASQLWHFALRHAVMQNLQPIVHLLLEEDVKIRATQTTNYRALELALISGNPAMVRLVLDRHVKLEETDYFGGKTALYLAIDRLLFHCPSVTAKTQSGESVYPVSQDASLECIKLLLKAGANPNKGKTGSRNKTPLHLVIWAYRMHRSPVDTCLAVANCLLLNGAKVHFHDEFHLCAMYDCRTDHDSHRYPSLEVAVETIRLPKKQYEDSFTTYGATL